METHGRITVSVGPRHAHLLPGDSFALSSGRFVVVRCDLISGSVDESLNWTGRWLLVLDPEP